MVPHVSMKDVMIALCYVDDLIFFARWKRSIVDVFHKLNDTFHVKDLGRPKQFLGLGFGWVSDGLFVLGQTQLVDKLLLDSKMDES